MKTRGNNGKTLADAYKHYNEKALNPANKKVFVNVCKIFNGLISTEILNGFEFKIPFKMGYISIRKFKRKIKFNLDGTLKRNKLRVDYAETIKMIQRKTGKSWVECRKMMKTREWTKFIYHFNDHTNGYTCRWYWDKYTSNSINKSIYKFIPTKFNRLAIPKMIKEDISIIERYTEFINHVKKKYVLL